MSNSANLMLNGIRYFHNDSWPLPHDYHESTPDYQWEHWPAAIACYAVSKTKPGNCGMHWHQKFLHVSISKSPGNFYNACPLDYDLSINNDAKRDHSSQGSIASTESQSDPGVLPSILSFSSCKGQCLQALNCHRISCPPHIYYQTFVHL